MVQTTSTDSKNLRASRPLSGRVDRYNSGFFIKHKRELTSLPVLRYSSGHRKGRLKILYLERRTAGLRMQSRQYQSGAHEGSHLLSGLSDEQLSRQDNNGRSEGDNVCAL